MISGINGQIVAPTPGTLKMHMTGMENFNAASKRGGPGAIPINSTVSPSLVVNNGDMSSATTMTGTNKSNM